MSTAGHRDASGRQVGHADHRSDPDPRSDRPRTAADLRGPVVQRPHWQTGWPPSPPTSPEPWRSSRWTGSPATRPRGRVIPDAVTVDPFHVVTLAGDARPAANASSKPWAGAVMPATRCSPHRRTRLQLLSTRQYARLTGVFDADEHLAVQLTWLIYQKIIAAYADPNRRRGKSHAPADRLDPTRGTCRIGRRSPSADPHGAAAPTSWPSSTTTPPTGRPKPSTDAWNTSRLRPRLPKPHPLHRPSALEAGGFRPRLHPGL